MSVADPYHTKIWLLSLQGELSMHIGTSLEMSEMLRNFLIALTQRLQLRSAQVWWLGENESLEHYAYPETRLAEWAALPQRVDGLAEYLHAPDIPGGVVTVAGLGPLHVLRIGTAAALFMEPDASGFNTAALPVLETLMPRLALACQACMDHRRSRALLELTRLQNRELEDARERAESAWRSKSEFLAAISHEMRTPLNSILGFSELLQLELANSEQGDYARSIHAAGRHLLAMFNDLLDLAKLDARRLILLPEDVCVRQLCEEVWLPHLAEAQRKGLKGVFVLTEDVPERILVDPVRLRQVLNNLLGNALKFTASGKLELRVSKVDELLAFAVVDTGPGIQADARERVFEPFCQAGHGHGGRNVEGAGLGLAIARELAEAMGGSILLDSTVGQGATFTLMLPPVDPGLLRGQN